MKPLWLLVAGWLAAAAIVAALVVDGRSKALERGHRAAEALAQIVEEHSARTFQSVSLALSVVADAWELSQPPKNDAGFRELLRERLQDLPYVRALFVIGPDGFVIHDTDFPRRSGVSLAGRPYFRRYLDDARLQREVSAPFSSGPGEPSGWSVAVTERLGRSGEMQGVVVAAVQPAYFEALYRKLELSEGDVIALFHQDGSLIARHPPGEEEIGKPFRELPLFSQHLPRGPSGTFATGSGMFPGERIVSYRTVEGLPLVARVSRTERAVLAEWRRTAGAAVIAMAALHLLLGGLLVQQIRRNRSRESVRAQRVQADKLEAMGQLTGGIAHDFANLLSLILMNLELIQRRPADAEQTRRAAAAARRAVDRGSELIRRLLAFARRQPLELKAADLNALLAEAHPLIAQAAGARIELVLQLAPDLP